MNNVLSVKQAAFLCSVLILASKLLMLPSLLFETNRFGGLLCLVAMFCFELGVLFLLIKIKEKHPNQSFFEYFSSFLGVVITKVIYAIFFIFFVLKMIYISHESFNFLKLVLYENADILVFYVCLLPVANALAHKGLKAFGRTLELFYYIIMVLLVLCCVMWISSITNLNFNILDNNGFAGFFAALFKYGFWFCDFVFLFIILDKVKLENNYGKKLMKYSGITMFILLFLFLSYYIIYQSSAFFHSSAILDIMQFSTRLGSVSKLDILPTIVVMFLLFYQMGMMLYCAKDCYKKVLSSKSDLQALIFTNFLFVISNYFVFYNLDIMIYSYRSIFSYLAFFVAVLIPILLMFVFGFERQKQNNIYAKPIIKNFYKY